MENYTIPKLNRELKRLVYSYSVRADYTIPKLNRELKHEYDELIDGYNYTIPKLNRELKPILVKPAIHKKRKKALKLSSNRTVQVGTKPTATINVVCDVQLLLYVILK